MHHDSYEALIPNCLRCLFVHDILRAASLAACTAGRSNPTKTPIIAITTSNSTKENPVEIVSLYDRWHKKIHPQPL